jgi:hypothetical protein
MGDSAECNQILRHIPAKLTPRLDVMNLQFFDATAVLAVPSISFQHLVSDHDVFFQVQFESRLLLAQAHRIRSAIHNTLLWARFF